MDSIPKREVTVLMGDMNTKVQNRCSTDISHDTSQLSKGTSEV